MRPRKCPECGCLIDVEIEFDDMGFTLRQFTGGDEDDDEDDDGE